MQRHIHKVHVYLAVTCHLHFWQNDQGLLCATAESSPFWTWLRIQKSGQVAQKRSGAVISTQVKKGEGSGKHSLERAGDLLLLVLAAVISAIPDVRVAVVIPRPPHQAMLVEVAGCIQALVCGHAQPGHLQATRETLSASESQTETRVCD